MAHGTGVARAAASSMVMRCNSGALAASTAA